MPNARAVWNTWYHSVPHDACPQSEASHLLASVADVDRPRAVECLLRVGARVAWVHAEQHGGQVDLERLAHLCSRDRLGLALLQADKLQVCFTFAAPSG